MGRQQRRQHRAFLQQRGFAGLGPAHLEHDIGIGQRGAGIGRDGGAGGDIIGIGDAGRGARAGLDHHVEAQALELLDRFRRRGDARFAGRRFLEDREFQSRRL